MNRIKDNIMIHHIMMEADDWLELEDNDIEPYID